MRHRKWSRCLPEFSKCNKVVSKVVMAVSPSKVVNGFNRAYNSATDSQVPQITPYLCGTGQLILGSVILCAQISRCAQLVNIKVKGNLLRQRVALGQNNKLCLHRRRSAVGASSSP